MLLTLLPPSVRVENQLVTNGHFLSLFFCNVNDRRSTLVACQSKKLDVNMHK